MRILPTGWAIPATHVERRREVVTRLTQITHGGTAAVAAACAVAAMGSYALEGCPAADLITVALEEFDRMATENPAVAVWMQNLRAAADATWRPGAGGVTLDAVDTLAAVVHVLAACGENVDTAMRYAVGLGGDTDTVAAITKNGLSDAVRSARGGPMGWGLANVNVALDTGEYGWDGTAGTIFWNDPAHEMITILMTQSVPANPDSLRQRFKALVAQAVE